MQLKRKEKIVLYIAVGIIAVFSIEKLFFAGLRRRIGNFHKQIKLDELTLKQAIDIQKRKNIILDEYGVYKKYLETIGLPEREISGKFLNEIEKIAQESGVSIVSLNPQEPEAEGDCQRYPAALRAEANIEQTIDFLSRVQSSNLLIKIDKLSLMPRDEAASALRIEMNISIIVLK